MALISNTGMASISRLARAKINLDLLITGQREDGFHLLDSLVVFADFGDEVSVLPSENLDFQISGPFAQDLEGEKDNIILKAARLIQDKFDVGMGARIELVKNLPVSSGIGGGSADAAATLDALMELWWVSDLASELGDLPLSLGADVPVCMKSESLQMTGIGEILHPVTLNFPLYLVLINSGHSVSTAEIFSARADRQPGFSEPRNLPGEISSLSQLTDILVAGGNDLEYDACVALPEIKNVLAQIRNLEGCHYASMSGSGATCFGVFSTFEAASRGGKRIFEDFPAWWVQPVQIV